MQRVFFVISFSTVLTEIQKELSSMSAKTGIAPTCITDSAVAKYVNDGSITSSPGLIPRATNDNISASVPELHEAMYFLFKNFAKFFS